MLEITPELTIDESELEERFIRASGPGGQNVNKVATAVQLSFDLRHTPVLSEEARRRAEKLAGRRLTSDGRVVIEARRFRTRERNREDARQRLVQLLRRALVPPTPRRRTRPTAASRRRRLEGKRRRSDLKKSRGRRDGNE